MSDQVEVEGVVFTQQDLEKFAARQEARPNGCREWMGALTVGYGRVRVGGVLLLAHRVAYALANGAIAKDLVVDHLCRNRRCVEPTHLELVTLAENTARGTNHVGMSIRAMHETGKCKNGHPTEGNRKLIGGKQRCVLCERERSRRRAATPEAKAKNRLRSARRRAKNERSL